MKIGVTGATGHLGSQVVKQLLKEARDEQIIALVHNPDHATSLKKYGIEIRKIDYLDKGSLNTSFTGLDVLVYIASKTYSLLDRIAELENVLSAVEYAGIPNLVAMSFIADQEDNPFVMSPFYGYLPRRLAGTKLNYAIAKNSLYADPLIPYLPELIERGGLIYPVGSQAMSFITIADSAEAIAKLALSQDLLKNRRSYLLTQTRSYTMSELGKIMSKVTGKTIGYHPVSVEEFGKIYASEGDGKELASMYQGGAMGYLEGLSDDFAHLTGHDPQGMEEFLKNNYLKQ
ncbi:NmrA family NAD(P)-binding protein [Lactobacillus corticis]|uniref:3-beta hydroxysteroid dehydrogenase n=1 Tax=Lactobacillus corticis TaxID=2201249 RepID=A0A916QKI9_9LACO|nr:NmrA family NAD(P)-binding protein [Lactobacillus corticis]GFZ27672.1 3-beta hydroxysteroid dehydrogenase [Lactobacillus corticis]